MYFSQRMAFALIASPSSASVMRCEMPILIDSVVKRGRGVVDTILLDGNEVRVPVVGDPITVERRHVVVVGRIRIGIGSVVGVVALPPHHTIGCPISERPNLVLCLVVGMGAVHRVVGVIEPGIPGIDRAQGRPWIGGIAGCPDAIDDEGVIGPVDGDADGIVVGDGVPAKVSAEVVRGGLAAGAVDPVVKPVRLGAGAHRRIVPRSIGDRVWIGTKITTDIRQDIASSGSPRARIRIETVVNGLLGVIPGRGPTIVIEPVVHLDGSNVGDATPVSLVLVPIVSRGVHPTVIGAIKRVAWRTDRGQLYRWIACFRLS